MMFNFKKIFLFLMFILFVNSTLNSAEWINKLFGYCNCYNVSKEMGNIDIDLKNTAPKEKGNINISLKITKPHPRSVFNGFYNNKVIFCG